MKIKPDTLSEKLRDELAAILTNDHEYIIRQYECQIQAASEFSYLISYIKRHTEESTCSRLCKSIFKIMGLFDHPFDPYVSERFSNALSECFQPEDDIDRLNLECLRSIYPSYDSTRELCSDADRQYGEVRCMAYSLIKECDREPVGENWEESVNSLIKSLHISNPIEEKELYKFLVKCRYR